MSQAYLDYSVDVIDDLTQMMQTIQEKFLDSFAFYKNHKHITYKEFYEDVARVQGGLKFHFTKIGIQLSDTYQFAVSYFATILSGNIAVLLPKANSDGLLKIVPCDFIIDANQYNCLISIDSYELKIHPLQSDECCTILFSSGTTATPKGVMLSSKNIATDVIAGMQKYEYPIGSKVINVIPLYHAFGLTCDLIATLYCGGEICCLDNQYEFFAAMKEFRPTMLNLPPNVVQSMLKLIVNSGDPLAAQHLTGGCLKKILSGGAGTSQDLIEKMRQFGIAVYGCYGLSECSPCVSVNRDDFFRDGSAGVALNCNIIQISPSQEIIITGENVMLGYYPSEMVKDKTFYTGDLGYIDEDGFLWVTGRKNDLIILPSGKKFFPQVLENEINGVEGVTESIVYMTDNNEEKIVKCIIVVSSESQTEAVLQSVKLISSLTSVIDTFKCQVEPIKRNVQGKIERRYYV